MIPQSKDIENLILNLDFLKLFSYQIKNHDYNNDDDDNKTNNNT